MTVKLFPFAPGSRRLGLGGNTQRSPALCWPLALAILLLSSPVRAYEPASTHAGMTERAALNGNLLHGYLTSVHGLPLGVFEPVRLHLDMVPYLHRLDLRDALGALDPLKGYKPDSRGYARALAWLAAGSVIEEIPFSRGRHHFLDPRTGKGLRNSSGRWGMSLRLRILDSLDGGGSFGGIITGSNFNLRGKSALRWARYAHNGLSLPQHWRHRFAALTAPTLAARRHHLAMALLTAGALLHLLQDMAVPAHVRNDFARTYLARRSNIELDRASAYESLVRRRYGRAGIPKVTGKPPRFSHFDDYFRNGRSTGLAQRTQRGHFSLGSLPPQMRLTPRMTMTGILAALRKRAPFPYPRVSTLRLSAAGGAGLYYSTRSNPYLFAYRIAPGGHLQVTLDDRCYRSSATRLVPLAVRYSAGLLAFLLRGRISMRRKGNKLIAQLSGVGLGRGKATLLWEGPRGRRVVLRRSRTPAGLRPGATLFSASLGALPKGARYLVLAWSGRDASGERLVMGARLKLGR